MAVKLFFFLCVHSSSRLQSVWSCSAIIFCSTGVSLIYNVVPSTPDSYAVSWVVKQWEEVKVNYGRRGMHQSSAELSGAGGQCACRLMSKCTATILWTGIKGPSILIMKYSLERAEMPFESHQIDDDTLYLWSLMKYEWLCHRGLITCETKENLLLYLLVINLQAGTWN